MLAINGMPDHLHFFMGLHPAVAISDLVREVKKSSNEFINLNQFTKEKFAWQVGFGAFSYSKSDIDRVVKYILNQKEHHRQVKFRNEFLKMLSDHEIAYDERYGFEWIDP